MSSTTWTVLRVNLMRIFNEHLICERSLKKIGNYWKGLQSDLYGWGNCDSRTFDWIIWRIKESEIEQVFNRHFQDPFRPLTKGFVSWPWGQASAILESIIVNHPFIDGNKRMGYVLMINITRIRNGSSIIRRWKVWNDIGCCKWEYEFWKNSEMDKVQPEIRMR